MRDWRQSETLTGVGVALRQHFDPNAAAPVETEAGLERGAGDCQCALSVSALRECRGQDRLRDVLKSRTVRLGEGHPIPERTVSQAKMLTCL